MSNWLLGLSELPEFYSTWEIYTSANEENNLQELINIEKVEDIRNKVAHNRIMEQEDYDFTVQKLSKVNSEIKTICRDIIFGLVKVEIDLTPLSKILDQQMQNITSVIQEMSNVGNSVQQVINNLTVPTKILGNSFTAIECSLQFTKPIHDFLNSNPFNNQIQMATDIMQKMNQVTRPFEDIQKIAREAAKKTYINPPILLDSVIDPDLPDSERIMRYIELLEMSYDDAVFMLKDSHGKVQGDYFLKESYDKFFSGKIKVLRKNNKISRLEDGLLTHHVLFDKYKKINESTSILSQSIPFEVQESKNLVYVDIWEKFILHVLKSRDKSRLDSEAKRRITQQDFSIRQPTLDMGLPTSYQCLVFKTTMIF
ncbi:hypothetical protein R53140_OCIKHKEL_01184 [Fructobacillus fructosus]|nr:hypothetical protein R53140_OCIKHKEL_01184 [Fructobacillus fructosus]